MKVLVVSTIVPERKYAGWIYVYGIIQAISKHSETMYWFSLLNRGLQPNIQKSHQIINVADKNLFLLKIKALLKNSYVAHGYHKEHLNSLRKTMENFQPDIVMFANLSSASYLFDVKNIKPDVYTLLIQHNVELSVVEDLSKHGTTFFQRIYHKLQRNLVERFESGIMSRVDLIISISPSDREYFVRNYGIPPEKIKVVRPIFEYEKNLFSADAFREEKVISFISSFDWYPNVEGTIFFVNNVLPELLRKFPKLKLYLVGRDPEKRIYKLQKRYPENIIVTGTVESVEEYYRISNCVVIPVFIGPGIKLKVLEAMASGVPTVMTSYVAKDYDLLAKGFCIADTPEEFVRYIEQILTDYDYARTISKKQIEWYENYLLSEKEKLETVLRRFFRNHE